MYSFATHYQAHPLKPAAACFVYPTTSAAARSDCAPAKPNTQTTEPSVSHSSPLTDVGSDNRSSRDSCTEPNMTTFYGYNGQDGSIMGYISEQVPYEYNPYADYNPNISYGGSYYPTMYNANSMHGSHGWPGPLPMYGPRVYAPTLGLEAHQPGEYESESEGQRDSARQDGHDADGYYSEEVLEAGHLSNRSVSECGNSNPYEQLHVRPETVAWYRNINKIRKLHDMRSLLDSIEPDRLHDALYGPMVNIVEEGTDHVLAYRVPKKMLMLICGRPAISKYLRTLEREDGVRSGAPVAQELRVPRGAASHVGFKILLSWMKRACYRETMGTMERIRVPKNLFAAISLARALELFGLHRDACRVDNIIADNHFKRPIYPDEISAIWKCLPKDSKYLFGVINVLRGRIEQANSGKGKPLHEGVITFLEKNPDLNARVRDPVINQQYEPFFGTEWCKYVKPGEEELAKKKRQGMPKNTSPKTEKKRFGVLRIVPAKPKAKNELQAQPEALPDTRVEETNEAQW